MHFLLNCKFSRTLIKFSCQIFCSFRNILLTTGMVFTNTRILTSQFIVSLRTWGLLCFESPYRIKHWLKKKWGLYTYAEAAKTRGTTPGSLMNRVLSGFLRGVSSKQVSREELQVLGNSTELLHLHPCNCPAHQSSGVTVHRCDPRDSAWSHHSHDLLSRSLISAWDDLSFSALMTLCLFLSLGI